MNRRFTISTGIVICVTGWMTSLHLPNAVRAEENGLSSSSQVDQTRDRMEDPQIKKTQNLRDGADHPDVKGELVLNPASAGRYTLVSLADFRHPAIQTSGAAGFSKTGRGNSTSVDREVYQGDGETRSGVEKIADWEYPVDQKHIWA